MAETMLGDHASLAVLAGTEVPAYLGPAAALVVAAAMVGYLSVRSRVVPIVGFLLAGVLIGPAQLGLVASTEAVDSVAEVGVILLLFTIGIEFSLSRLATLWQWIVLGGGAQVLMATAGGYAAVALTGGGWRAGVFTGFLVALSSTAIVLKLMSAAGQTGSTRGRLSLSVLIFQDLAVVAMVLVVPLLGADGDGGPGALARALGVAVAVIVLVVVVARRVMPPLLERVAALCSPEVFLLAVVAICFGTAYLTALAGVSVSLGAFLAGLVVSESRHSTHALAEVLPLQIIFSAVFFVSVGMLLDVGFLLANLPLVLAVAALVLLGKTATTTLALLPLRVGWREALATGLLLAQVGEFSFVLLTVGLDAGLSPAGLGERGAQTFVATTVLLMLMTPALSAAGGRLTSGGRHALQTGSQAGSQAGTQPGAQPGPATNAWSEQDERGRPVALLGWGEDTLVLARELRKRGFAVAMTTLNPGGASAAERQGLAVVRGDPRRLAVLREAGVLEASLVVIAEDEPEHATQIATIVRGLTTAPVLVASHPDAEPVDVAALAEAGVSHVVEAGRARRTILTTTVLDLLGAPRPAPPPPTRKVGRTWVDPTRLLHYRWPEDADCPHGSASVPVLPGSAGCAVCLAEGTAAWVHLRICLTCGHVGCCDSSPGQHARAHHDETDHPLVASVEPGETWAFCFLDDTTVPRPDEDPRPS